VNIKIIKNGGNRFLAIARNDMRQVVMRWVEKKWRFFNILIGNSPLTTNRHFFSTPDTSYILVIPSDSEESYNSGSDNIIDSRYS
jgi:hypothetical protein